MGELTDNYHVGISIGEYACGQTRCSVVSTRDSLFPCGYWQNSFIVLPSSRTIKTNGNGGIENHNLATSKRVSGLFMTYIT